MFNLWKDSLHQIDSLAGTHIFSPLPHLVLFSLVFNVCKYGVYVQIL